MLPGDKTEHLKGGCLQRQTPAAKVDPKRVQKIIRCLRRHRNHQEHGGAAKIQENPCGVAEVDQGRKNTPKMSLKMNRSSCRYGESEVSNARTVEL